MQLFTLYLHYLSKLKQDQLHLVKNFYPYWDHLNKNNFIKKKMGFKKQINPQINFTPNPVVIDILISSQNFSILNKRITQKVSFLIHIKYLQILVDVILWVVKQYRIWVTDAWALVQRGWHFWLIYQDLSLFTLKDFFHV